MRRPGSGDGAVGRAILKEIRGFRRDSRRQFAGLDRAIELLAENHVRLIGALDQRAALMAEIRDAQRKEGTKLASLIEGQREQTGVLRQVARRLGIQGNGRNGGGGGRRG